MPKSPNYQFERRERDRLKAIRVAEKAAAKRDQQARARDRSAPTDSSDFNPENT